MSHGYLPMAWGGNGKTGMVMTEVSHTGDEMGVTKRATECTHVPWIFNRMGRNGKTGMVMIEVNHTGDGIRVAKTVLVCCRAPVVDGFVRRRSTFLEHQVAKSKFRVCTASI